MNRRFLICIFCFLLGPCAFGGMAEANRLYAAGDFAGAAAAYEELLTKEGPDAAVYYNLGNSYQSLKRYGPAILAYERAKLLTPRDPDLLANLAMARKAATAFAEPGPNPRLEGAVSYLSRDEWSWLAGGSALLLGLLAVARGAVCPAAPGLRRVMAAAAGGALLLMSASGAALWLRRGEGVRGIVLTDDAAVRLSPFLTAESLGTPGAGRMVRLGKEKRGYWQVEVAGTKLAGWMVVGEVARVEKDGERDP
jgi:Tetratricopeptide repeat